MADQKDKGRAPGAIAPDSPFAGAADWDSELAAWDAALPIADEERRNGEPEPAREGEREREPIPFPSTPVEEPLQSVAAPFPDLAPEPPSPFDDIPPPPDMDSVEFEAELEAEQAEQAEQAEITDGEGAVALPGEGSGLALPGMTPPAAPDAPAPEVPPLSDSDELRDYGRELTDPEAHIDASDAVEDEEDEAPDIEMLDEAPVTPPPLFPRPPEGSGLLVIPGIDELDALSRSSEPTPTPPPSSARPTRRRTLPPTPVARESSQRNLTDDGLPELSGLFNLDAGQLTPGIHERLPLDPYEAEPPPEEKAPLDLAFPVAPLGWAPQDIARRLASKKAAAQGETPGAPGDRRYWRDQLAFWTDEVDAAREEPGGSEVTAQRAVAAAIAAEHAGQRDVALKLYEQALALDAGSLSALRGQLRLRPRGAAGRELLWALLTAAGDEREAYQGLLADGETETGPSRALSQAGRALRADKPAEAAEALAEAGRALGGAVGAALLAQAARFRELAGDDAEAARLRAEAHERSDAEQAVPFGALRQAVRAGAVQARPLLEEAAEELSAPPVQIATLRWAARLARAAGDVEGARGLLARAGRLLGAATAPSLQMPERDRLEIAGDADEAPGDDAGLTAEGRTLLALRRATRGGARAPAAVSTLAAALAREPTAVPLALAAETLAFLAKGDESADRKDAAVRAAACALWAEGDPARRAFAHRLRADALAAAGDEPGAREALRIATEIAPEDPTFWELAWAHLRAGERLAAAAALERGAGTWASAIGAEGIASALDERAGELRRAANPAEALGESAALTVDVGSDDPAALVGKMLAPQAQPAAIAAVLKHEAPVGFGHRALEAAGWMLQAGAGRDALAWLLERRTADPDAPLPPAVALLLRRLIRVYGDPAIRPQILTDLSQTTAVESERQLLTFQRAEALEAAGERAAAAILYRSVRAGALGPDADLALRRVLWAAQDEGALTTFLRDQAAAEVGPRSAAALVELAHAQLELSGDAVASLESLREAYQRDPDHAEARWALLVEAVRGGRFGEALPLLEETAARVLPTQKPALLSLAALLDDGRAGGKQTGRLVRAALAESKDTPSLSLLLRAITSETAHTPNTTAAADLMTQLAHTMASLPGRDGRAVAIQLVRAAEVHEVLGDSGRMEALLREALGHDPDCLPALVRLRRTLLMRSQWMAAAEVVDNEATVLHTPEHQAKAWLLGSAIAETKLDDRRRAASLLRRVLEADPTHGEAFERLRGVFESQDDYGAVAELLAVRVRGAADPEQVAAVRLERAGLLAGPLNDRAGAKEELRALLAEQPQHLSGLEKLAALEHEDGAFAVAAELLIRQARFDRDPGRLRDIFLRIGRIYLRRLPDLKLATGAYERVLRLEPENKEALEALSELYSKLSETRKALAVTEPLVERETDPQKRLPFLLRIAGLWEKAGDPRRAGSTLKRASEESPRSLQAVGELARFYERTKEATARHVLLDRSIGLLRSDLVKDPRDVAALRSIIPLLRWRQRHTCSAAAAQMLTLFSEDEAERNEAMGWAAPPQSGRRLTALANPELDDLALPQSLPRGIRTIMRLLGPTLARATKPNLKRWDVGRNERQPTGSPVRMIADAVAVDLGVRAYDIYVSTARPQALAVEPGEIPVLILGSDIATLGAQAVRFASAHALRLVATHFDLLAQGGAADAGVLLAGLVRQFFPDYRHPELSEGDVAAAGARIARALPKNLRNELAPFAAEIASPFSLEGLFAALQDAASRVGLLACGDLAAALSVLCLRAGESLGTSVVLTLPSALALVDFALSEEHEELVAALDAVA